MTRQLLYALLFNLFIAQPDAEPDANCINVCKGDSVKLFADATFNPQEESSITLYHNGNSIGLWTSNEPKCNNKIYRDGNRDIWLHGFNESDNGVYVLRSLRRMFGTTNKQKERQFLVAIPPLASCKPQIAYQRLGQENGYLTATLPTIGCGNPIVTLIWLNRGNQQYNNFMNLSQDHSMHIVVNSMENPGPYIVCMTGPALRCVRDRPITDYCSEIHVPVYKSEERQLVAVKCTDTTNESHRSDAFIISTFVIVALFFLVYLTLNFRRIRNMWRRCRNKNPRQESHGDNQGKDSSATLHACGDDISVSSK